MNIIEYTGTLPLPDGVYARYFRPGGEVEFVRELLNESQTMVLWAEDADGHKINTRIYKGDLILYEGDRKEVVKKDTLAHKFLQETILPNKEVKRKYWKEYEAEDYIPDIEQKKIWSKVGSKPENAETSTGVDDIESTGILGDNIPYVHLNYEYPCWRTPYDKDDHPKELDE